LDIADTGQQERGEHIAVGEAVANAMPDLLQEAVAGSGLDQTDEGFDAGVETDSMGRQMSLGRPDGWEVSQKRESAEAKAGPRGGTGTQE
jgi:hypothetical protein